MHELYGGQYMDASQKAMALKGRMMMVGTVACGSYELDARYVMGKRLTITGTALHARRLEEKINVTQAFATEVAPLFADGVLRPNIDSTFKMSEIAKAHERLESNLTLGKVTLEIE